MFRSNLSRPIVSSLTMSAFVCMQRLGLECLFGVLYSVTSLSLIYPLRDAYLAAVFSTYTHICVLPCGAIKMQAWCCLALLLKVV